MDYARCRIFRGVLSHPARDVDLKGAAVAVLVSILWGANPVAIKLGLEDAPPIRLAWMRFLVGGVVIGLWAWATGRFAGFRVERSEWRPLVFLGLLFTLQIGSMNIRPPPTSPPPSALLLNPYPGPTVVPAPLPIPRARPPPPQNPGRAVQRYDPVKLLLSQALIGTAIFVAVSLALEPAATRWTGRLAASVAYQGVLIAGFNFVVNLWLLRRYRPSALAAFFLTQPIFGVIAAALVGDDPLTLDLLLASVTVAIGIGLTSSSEGASTAPSEPPPGFDCAGGAGART